MTNLLLFIPVFLYFGRHVSKSLPSRGDGCREIGLHGVNGIVKPLDNAPDIG